MKKKVCIILPVFRNEATLNTIFNDLEGVFIDYKDEFTPYYYFVNDGSDDQSQEILLGLRASNERVNIIELARNFGQVPAITAGLKQAEGDLCLILSADLQDPVSLIPKMIEAWKQGNQIVIAHRENREDHALSKISSGLFYKLMKFSKLDLPSGGFDYVLLDKKAHQALNQVGGRNRFLQGDILWLGFETKLIPYERKSRPLGKSQWSFGKKLKYLLDGVLSTSYWPIRLMSLIGFLTACSGFTYVGIIIYMRIVESTPFNGWAPIMVMILVIGGLIMLMLGIIGEYIWRIYDEVRGRPYFVVKEVYPEINPLRT